jgi:signal transduction histidine kinase
MAVPAPSSSLPFVCSGRAARAHDGFDASDDGAPLFEALLAPPPRPSRLGLVEGSQPVFLAAAALTLLAIVLAVGCARLGAPPGWARFLDNVHWSVADLGAALLAWLGVRDARRQGLGVEARARRWFALGFGSYALGQGFWNMQAFLGWQPFPAPSDPFYLMFSPCIAIGFMTALQGRVSRAQRVAAVLDTLSLAIAVVAVALVAYLPERGEMSTLALGVMIAYPTLLFSTACIGLMLIALLRVGRRSWGVWALVMVLGLHAMLWMEWNAMTLRRALVDGGLVNAAFSICTLMGGLAASTWRPHPSTSVRVERFCEGVLRLVPLVVVVGVSFAVMMQDSIARLSPSARAPCEIAAVLVIVLAAARQTMLLRDRDALFEAQRQLREREEQLRELNLHLELRVSERTQEAERRNAELSTALQRLSMAQHELVRAERLAGLGALVTGVATELTSVLARARMAAAALPAQGDAGQVQLAQSLDQAERVVTEFQQVAIDQTSEQRRTFDLLSTVSEMVDLTRLSLRGEPIAIEVTGEPGLMLDSYPGHVGQVLGQLIRNAVVHGLPGGSAGTVAVRVWPTLRDDVRITVHDDGAGIAPDDLARVFEPFFTTRAAQGGSGLGLTLCRDIVNGLLGGRIEIVSPPEAGTTVTVTLPRHAPRSAA